MPHEFLSLHFPGLDIDQLTYHADHIEVEAHSRTRQAECPDCGQLAHRRHSRYQRHPRDLPWCGTPVRLRLTLSKFFCDQATCPRRVFVERLPELVPLHVQATHRCRQTWRQCAFGLGAELGARLLTDTLGLPTSPDTLLRLLRSPLNLPAAPPPRVIGIDDWAYRKGRVYGTLICDLERQTVIDLLPDREAATVATWLKAHPTVEIVSRDRGNTYIEGITLGAPHVQQVADRWHLLKNLGESVTNQLARLHRHFQWTTTPTVAEPTVPATDILETPRQQATRAEKRNQRLAKYHQMITLCEQGQSRREVAAAVGVTERTVARYWHAPAFPERQRRHGNQSGLLDPFLPYVRQQWEAGCRNAKVLYQELQAQGFQGSYDTVAAHLQRLRLGFTLRRDPCLQPPPPTHQQLSPGQATWLLMLEPGRLNPTQTQNLAALLQHYPNLRTLYELIQGFVQLMQQRQVARLATWWQQVERSEFPVLHSFVKGLRRDEAAVRAGIALEWSNGQTEGQVNRLKLLKRQMYGRAKFDLLRQRVLMHL